MVFCCFHSHIFLLVVLNNPGRADIWKLCEILRWKQSLVWMRRIFLASYFLTSIFLMPVLNSFYRADHKCVLSISKKYQYSFFFWESKRSVSVISATIQSFLMSLRHFRIQVEVAVTSCCNWRHCKTISAGKYHRLSISHEEAAQTNGHQAVFCFFHRWFKTQNHTHFRPFICSPLHSGSWIWIFQHSLYRDYWENFSCVRSTAEIWKKCMYFWRRKLLSMWNLSWKQLNRDFKENQ